MGFRRGRVCRHMGSASLNVWGNFYHHMLNVRKNANKFEIVAEKHCKRVADMLAFLVGLHIHGPSAYGDRYPSMVLATALMLTGLANIHEATKNALMHQDIRTRQSVSFTRLLISVIHNEADSLHNVPTGGLREYYPLSHRFNGMT